MRLNLGWDRATCAKNFHVTERTLHNWETGKNDIPFTAYKLLRLLNRMELPGDSWRGWYFLGGTLYTPEGHPLTGQDGSWWSLLVRRAAMFDQLCTRVHGGGTVGARTPGGAPACGAGPGASAAAVPPAPAGGRREAPPPLDLSIEHICTNHYQPDSAVSPRKSDPNPAPASADATNLIAPALPPRGSKWYHFEPWHSPSDSPPISKPTPAPAASGWASASTPWWPWRLTITFEVALAQQGHQTATQAPRSPRPPLPLALPEKSPPKLPQGPGSTASNAAGWHPARGEPPGSPGEAGANPVPEVPVLSRSVPPAWGLTLPARPQHPSPPVRHAPAASVPPRPGNGPPRATPTGLTQTVNPRPGKTGFDYVDNQYETIISGWGR